VGLVLADTTQGEDVSQGAIRGVPSGAYDGRLAAVRVIAVADGGAAGVPGPAVSEVTCPSAL